MATKKNVFVVRLSSSTANCKQPHDLNRERFIQTTFEHPEDTIASDGDTDRISINSRNWCHCHNKNDRPTAFCVECNISLCTFCSGDHFQQKYHHNVMDIDTTTSDKLGSINTTHEFLARIKEEAHKRHGEIDELTEQAERLVNEKSLSSTSPENSAWVNTELKQIIEVISQPMKPLSQEFCTSDAQTHVFVCTTTAHDEGVKEAEFENSQGNINSRFGMPRHSSSTTNNTDVLHEHNPRVKSRNYVTPSNEPHITKRQKRKQKRSDTFIKKQSTKYPSTYYIKQMQKPIRIKTNGAKMGDMFGIAINKAGIWAAVDNSNHCVHIFNANNMLIKILGSEGNGNGQFNHPTGVTFDGDDNLYISDHENHRVQKFDACTFAYVLQFGSKGKDNGQLHHPMGMASYEDKLYIADSNNNRIAVFYTDGNFCCNIVSDLHCPYGVAVNKTNRRLLITDSTCCIRIYSLEGEYINRISGFGVDRGHLNQPLSLAVHSDGLVFVADTYNHRVSIFDNIGTFVHSFGSYGDTTQKFKQPKGIAFSPNGTVYVSDFGNQRVAIFENKFKPGQK